MLLLTWVYRPAIGAGTFPLNVSCSHNEVVFTMRAYISSLYKLSFVSHARRIQFVVTDIKTVESCGYMRNRVISLNFDRNRNVIQFGKTDPNTKLNLQQLLESLDDQYVQGGN